MRFAVPALVVAVIVCFGAGCAKPIAFNPANVRRSIVVGSKDFKEQYVLGQIYAQALFAAGYRVSTRFGWADEQAAFRALRKGQIDAYPEYTGIVLESIYGYRSTAVPHSAGAAYRVVRRLLSGVGIRALPHAPANDTLTLVMTTPHAKDLGSPRTIADLKGKAGRLTIAGDKTCRHNPICFPALARRYHLHFKRWRSTKHPYDTLVGGQADVAFGFTTDPGLTTGFTALRDDRRVFPSFHITLLIRKRLLARLGPDARRVIARVQEPLTTAMLRELDRRATFGDQTPAHVARDYLREQGFVR
jgi:glycine betaine/choline ABC-type transport system substrate-binding protein